MDEITLDKLLATWIEYLRNRGISRDSEESRQYKETTLNQYKNNMYRLAKIFEFETNTIMDGNSTKNILNKIHTHLQRDGSHLSCVAYNSFSKYVYELGLITTLLRTNNIRNTPRPIKDVEFNILMENLSGESYRSKRTRAEIILGRYAGASSIELSKLGLIDLLLDKDNPNIVLCNASEVIRELSLPKYTKETLETYMKVRPVTFQNFFLLNRSGGNIEPRSIRKDFEDTRKDAGLSNELRFNSLVNAFRLEMILDSGLSSRELADIFGLKHENSIYILKRELIKYLNN